MYGESATALVRHITRHHPEVIPPYQHELVEEIMKENEELYAENLRSSQNENVDEKEIMVMQVRHTAKLWNKKCIIAYHYKRLTLLKQSRWDLGNNLPNKIVQNLSKDELEWFTKYNENLFSYMNSLNNGEGLDLTLYQNRPKELYIRVRCLIDYGQYNLEQEARHVLLKRNGIHFLPLNQCEKLIQEGVLEQLL